jgi:O-succinylbenzoate synthase
VSEPLAWTSFAIAMRTRFRGISAREGMLALGPQGWTEWSPFWDYDAAESATWLAAAHEAAFEPWPTPLRTRIPVNCTVPAVGPGRARQAVLTSGGCRTAKVKVAEPGQTLSDDVARVEAVAEALGAGGRVRVDANGGWSVDAAVDAIGVLNRAVGGLEYVEQPCATVEELARVRRRVEVPIAADESIRRAADPMRVRELEAADVAVLKVQPIGGVHACLRVAEQIGLPVVVSSALETSVGLAAGLALAAALPELPFACGLNTLSLLDGDVTADPLRVEDGTMQVRRPAADPDLLRRYTSPELPGRWDERLAATRAAR